MAGIIVGSVGVQLVPSADGFSEKTRSLLRGLSVPVKLDVDDTAARTQLEEFTRPRETTVNVNADTGAAETKIAALGAESAAAGGGMNGLLVTALALGPALIPVTAAVGGLVAALAAPILATGGGLAVFGVVAATAVKQVEKTNKAIDALQKKAASTTNAKTKAQYLSQIKDLQDSLGGGAKSFLAAQGALSAAFGKLMKSAGGSIFGPLAKGMNLLSAILPKIQPLLSAVASAIDTLLGRVSHAVKDGSFAKFIGWMSGAAKSGIVSFGTILGNIARGVLSMGQAFGGTGNSIIKTIEKWSAGFANIGKSQGFKSFVGYVAQVGPLVAKTLGDVAGALMSIVKALAPAGSLALILIDALAQLVKKTPAPVLAAIVMSLGALVAGLAPIPALVAGLVAALVNVAGHSKSVRSVLGGLATFIKDRLPASIAALKSVWNKDLLPAFSNAWKIIQSQVIPPLKDMIGKFLAFLPVVIKVAGFILKYLIPALALFVGITLKAQDTVWKAGAFIVNAFKKIWSAGKTMWNVLKSAFRFIVDAFLNVASVIIHGAANAFSWIPGIGDKLSGAATAFDNFRTSVNNALDGIHNKTVTVTVHEATVFSRRQSSFVIPPTTVPGISSPIALSGGRAVGGSVSAGRAYIVGEHRPEVYVPEQNGRIISSIQRAQSGALAAPAAGGAVNLSGAAFTLVLDDGTPLTGYISDIADDRVRANTTMQQQTARAGR